MLGRGFETHQLHQIKTHSDEWVLIIQELSLQLLKMKDSINIVWLKRDLRITDHLPLYEAEKKQYNYIIIYLFEPNQINYVDYSLRHKQFIYHSIIEMNKLLKKYNREVIIYNENADVIFAKEFCI